MIKKISISTKVVEQLKEISVDFPNTPKYYQQGATMYETEIRLFAIIPKYKDSTHTYGLIKVDWNKQDSNDFVPEKDCRSEYWINGCPLRKLALDIFQKNVHTYVEISKEDFDKRRLSLINKFQEYGT